MIYYRVDKCNSDNSFTIKTINEFPTRELILNRSELDEFAKKNKVYGYDKNIRVVSFEDILAMINAKQKLISDGERNYTVYEENNEKYIAYMPKRTKHYRPAEEQEYLSVETYVYTDGDFNSYSALILLDFQDLAFKVNVVLDFKDKGLTAIRTLTKGVWNKIGKIKSGCNCDFSHIKDMRGLFKNISIDNVFLTYLDLPAIEDISYIFSGGVKKVYFLTKAPKNRIKAEGIFANCDFNIRYCLNMDIKSLLENDSAYKLFYKYAGDLNNLMLYLYENNCNIFAKGNKSMLFKDCKVSSEPSETTTINIKGIESGSDYSYMFENATVSEFTVDDTSMCIDELIAYLGNSKSTTIQSFLATLNITKLNRFGDLLRLCMNNKKLRDLLEIKIITFYKSKNINIEGMFKYKPRIISKWDCVTRFAMPTVIMTNLYDVQSKLVLLLIAHFEITRTGHLQDISIDIEDCEHSQKVSIELTTYS